MKEINFEGSVIQTIPNSIGELYNLEVISLNNTNVFSIPESIGRLSKLRVLNLKNSKITNFPDSFCNLTSLETLDIKGNKFSGLSEKIDQFLLILKRRGIIHEQDDIPPFPDEVRKF